jgi:hypothetical protein
VLKEEECTTPARWAGQWLYTVDLRARGSSEYFEVGRRGRRIGIEGPSSCQVYRTCHAQARLCPLRDKGREEGHDGWVRKAVHLSSLCGLGTQRVSGEKRRRRFVDGCVQPGRTTARDPKRETWAGVFDEAAEPGRGWGRSMANRGWWTRRGRVFLPKDPDVRGRGTSEDVPLFLAILYLRSWLSTIATVGYPICALGSRLSLQLAILYLRSWLSTIATVGHSLSALLALDYRYSWPFSICALGSRHLQKVKVAREAYIVPPSLK